MKTFVFVMCYVVGLLGCEVAELPPLAEVRDTRDTREVDTTPNPTDTVAPDTVAPDTVAPVDTDVADDTEPGDTAPSDTDPGDTSDDTDPGDTDPGDTSGDTEPGDTSDDTDPGDTAPSDTHGDTEPPTCTPITATPAVIASPHITTCSEVTYPTDPPTSGPHYPIWAAFKTYGVAINPGFLVHSLEHGAVVITWRCPSGCDADLAALQAMLDTRPADPLCDPLIKHRIIVAPRPDQDTTLAAWAWGASWKADCFDLDALSAFIDTAYAKGPEDFCSQGVDIETILPDNAWHCPP